MVVIHEELWRFQDPVTGIEAYVYRIPNPREGPYASGELRIRIPGRDPVSIPVTLSPGSPTEEDDQDWFNHVLPYLEDLTHE